MAVATLILSVHMTRTLSLSFVPARLDTPMSALQPMSAVKVTYQPMLSVKSQSLFPDSCTVDNGGCDKNAICSHDKGTFAVVCTCKTGYTNVGTGATVKCEGQTELVRSNMNSFWFYHNR